MKEAIAQLCFVVVFSLLVWVLCVLSTNLTSSTFSLVPLMMDEALNYLEKRQVFSFCIQNFIFLCTTYKKSVIYSLHILVYTKTVLLSHLEVMLLSLTSYFQIECWKVFLN